MDHGYARQSDSLRNLARFGLFVVVLLSVTLFGFRPGSPSVLFAQVAPPGADQGNSTEDKPAPPPSLEDFKEAHRKLIGLFGEKGSVSVEGVVTDEQGRPIRDAAVGFGPYGLLPFQCNRQTDEAGKFRVGWVPKSPGDLSGSIVACADGYAATRIRFAKPPGSYTLSIRLKPGKAFRGRVLDEEGNPIRSAFAIIVAKVPDEPKWTVQYRADSDAEGRVAWKGVCAEDVTVYVGKPGPIDKIGYHAVVASGRADGKERVIRLKRLAGESFSNPPLQTYGVIACFVEPRGDSDGKLPLYGLVLEASRPWRFRL